MGAFHSKLICYFQSRRCVCSRARWVLGYPLSEFGVSPHPTAGWTLGIAWCGLVRTPPSVESSWRWVLGIFCRSLAAWARWPGFSPFRLQHIFPRVHMFVCDLPKPYYNLAKIEVLRIVLENIIRISIIILESFLSLFTYIKSWILSGLGSACIAWSIAFCIFCCMFFLYFSKNNI